MIARTPSLKVSSRPALITWWACGSACVAGSSGMVGDYWGLPASQAAKVVAPRCASGPAVIEASVSSVPK
jgi:hypothetical protein